jgi:crossover junction endodeoxyribonuclease RuvC
VTRILGIDPGLTGAIAAYHPGTENLIVEDVPTLRLPKGKTTKAYVDLMALGRIIDCLVEGEPPPVVYIERVGSMPGQGIASSFDFGRTTGILQGVCAAHFLRIEQVTPQVWKKALKVPASKDGARARASQIFPRYASFWARAKDDGRAEAALIAFYGATVFGNSQ